MKVVLEARSVDRQKVAAVYKAEMEVSQKELLAKEAQLAKANRILEVLKDRLYRLDGRVGMRGALGNCSSSSATARFHLRSCV